ncbi:MAG: GNAT family N-acetyltransferase [Nanoarchaeota archaeon]
MNTNSLPPITPTEIEVQEISLLYDLHHFDCGDEDLNEFLKIDSLKYRDQLIAKTFLVIYKEQVVAFFSVMNDAIKLKLEETKGTQDLTRLHEYPALKVGRLGVDKNYQRRGLGKICFNFILGLARKINDASACRFITVDSYSGSVSFYERGGFKRNALHEKKNHFVSMRFDLLQKE